MIDQKLPLQRLLEKTNCSQEKGKEALDKGGGSLLSAVLYLEEKGEVSPPFHENEGFFSTKDLELSSFAPENLESPTTTVHSFFEGVKRELFQNYFQFYHQDHQLGRMPVFVLLLLFPVTFGSLFLLLLLPQFFNIYYRFSLEGSFLAEFNPIMKRVGATFASLGRKINKR